MDDREIDRFNGKMEYVLGQQLWKPKEVLIAGECDIRKAHNRELLVQAVLTTNKALRKMLTSS